MGKLKEQFMQMREQEELAQQQPSINQLNNNKMTKKTMQEKLRKQPEPIV